MNFKVTIVTSPASGLNVEKEVTLAKLGLLYSDEVSICSPNLTAVLTMIRLANLSGKEKIEFIKTILPSLDKKITPEQFDLVVREMKRLKNKKGKTKLEIIALQKYDRMFSEYDKQMTETANGMFLTSGLHEISSYISSGKLKINFIELYGEKASENFFNETLKIINEPSTYPILDSEIETLTNLYFKEKNIQVNLSNSKEMVFGKDLLLRLPNIENLSLYNILQLKGELVNELNKFKQLVYDYSKEIGELPFDPNTKIEIEKRYEREIKPQLVELQQQIDGNRFLGHITSGIMGNLTKYGLFMGVATWGDLEKIILGTGGLTITEGLFKAAKETRKVNSEIKKNSLYFYHRLSQS